MEKYLRSCIFESLDSTGKQPKDLWQLSDFEILSNLQPGLSGNVCIAREISSGKKCLLKQIEIGTQYYNTEAIIQNEIQITRSLASNGPSEHITGIIKLYGYFVRNCIYYLVFEHGGLDILDYINYHGILDLNLIKKMFKQMVEAVNYCHANGIMHRDIKLENFVYNSDTGIIKLIDFGFATTDKVSSKKTGTHFYFPPEINQINPYSRNCSIFYAKYVDIWSLGCVFFVMLKGHFSLDTTKSAEKIGKPLCEIIGSLKEELVIKDPGIRDLLFKMLEVVSYQRATSEELLKHEYFEN